MTTTIPTSNNTKNIDLKIVSKDFKVTTPIEQKVQDEMKVFGKLEKHLKEVKLTFNVIKGDFVVVGIVKFKGKTLKAKATSGDLYKSIDLAFSKLKKQMEKHPSFIKGKEKTFKFGKTIKPVKAKGKRNTGYSKSRFLNDESLKPMFKEEAKMQMKLAGLRSFHYIDAETFEPAIVYNKKAS